MNKEQHLLNNAINYLSDPAELRGFIHIEKPDVSLPSQSALQEIVSLCRAVLFPSFFSNALPNEDSLLFHVGVEIEGLKKLLSEQIEATLSTRADEKCATKKRANEIAVELISKLPNVRKTLITDVEAAYNGDPAAESYDEIICCYPVIKALINYRVAHELYLLGVPLIPRLITELAHSETGIDIHPGATIGTHFTIDHGTGVVIGATCIIGNNVKLYQGVTLGAKSFCLDENGNPVKGIPRHPILGNNIVVYSNATILGRITIGDNVVIGGNIWVTEDVPAGSVIRQGDAKTM